MIKPTWLWTYFIISAKEPWSESLLKVILTTILQDKTETLGFYLTVVDKCASNYCLMGESPS